MSSVLPPSSGRIHPQGFAVRVLAIAALPLALLGWSWRAAFAPSGASGLGPGEEPLEATGLGKALAPEAVAGKEEAEIEDSLRKALGRARMSGADPRECLERAFPDEHRVIGMLSLQRDIDDFVEYGAREGRIGEYYRREAELAKLMIPLRSRYEAAYRAAYSELLGIGEDEAAVPGIDDPTADYLGGGGRKKPYIASPKDVWLPARSDLAKTHPYALDVFFFRVDARGEVETGPAIKALYPGIVVAASADWAGGQGPEAWRDGGLSPAAGNGLIVYDPSRRRFCAYFHLSSLRFKVGDIVKAGETIGRGGNSGMNARKKGHGEHVHFEIFDAPRGSSLSIYELYELLRK